MFDFDDITADEERAEAAAERRRLRPHWCRDCLGRVGPGSPCYEEPEEQENEE
jgi:hypothetical protein